MLANSPSDISRCRKIADRIGELRRKELVRLVQSIAEVRANLTEDQLAQLEKLKF